MVSKVRVSDLKSTSPEPSSTGSLVSLARGGWVLYEQNWLGRQEADELLARLQDELCWQQRSLRIFGRPVLEPRLVAWAGELPYRYSGQTLPPLPRPGLLDPFWRRAEAFSGARFNHVLINRYRNGNDYMGWHADDEPELGSNPLIFSLSLGAARRFILRPRRPRSDDPEAPHQWSLLHGSALLMGGNTQHAYQHAVLRQRRVEHQRINLTFRYLQRAPFTSARSLPQ